MDFSAAFHQTFIIFFWSVSSRHSLLVIIVVLIVVVVVVVVVVAVEVKVTVEVAVVSSDGSSRSAILVAVKRHIDQLSRTSMNRSFE